MQVEDLHSHSYVFKEIKMQDLDFTAVNAPSATDTKYGSTCESAQLLEIRITALNWIMLLRSNVRDLSVYIRLKP